MHDIIKPAFRNILIFILLPVMSLIMHWRVFNYDLIGIHVWRQTQTQTVINNFFEEDNNILNPRINARGDGDGIYRMEFPVMQWLIAQSYLTPENHVLITRIWMFFIGLLSAFGMYILLQALFRNKTIAAFGAWAFYFSPEIFYYTVNPLPDNFALCCTIWFLAFFFKWTVNQKKQNLFLSAFFICTGALAKLPFILFYIIPVIWLLVKNEGTVGIKIKKSLKTILFYFLFSIPVLLWYGWVLNGWMNNPVLTGGFEKENRSLGLYLSYLWHNTAITLPEVLINYASVPMFLVGLVFIFKNRKWNNPAIAAFLITGLFLLLYFLYELNAIHVSHDYYLFPFLPLIFCIVAKGIQIMLEGKLWQRRMVIILIILMPFTAYLRMNIRWNEEKPGFNNNLLIYKNELRSLVPDDALCITGNDDSRFIFMYYIHKKGWNFNVDRIKSENVKAMIDAGAEYMYCDSRKIDQDTTINIYFEKQIFTAGDIYVYKLKSP